ncbi:MAG: hypothetical protein EOP47_10270 [Sphingobacteriaceae bacterium]|nr:MAG: hypothetical protein EOP47_10270 [Sphingobacteriaceae bacterium]
MKNFTLGITLMLFIAVSVANAQTADVKIVKSAKDKSIDVIIGDKLFTSFMYPDRIEKPVLYPIKAANGTIVTRNFPAGLDPKDPLEPTDHPHHIGLWFNYENVNGLDFWNNSEAIPQNKKSQYGWIKTDRILKAEGGKSKGTIAYHANWTNQANEVLLEEITSYEFSGTANTRIIDRVTTLKANTLVDFKDAKDGMLGIRLAHALQIPTTKDETFNDSKGIATVVKGGTDKIPTGNYLTSEGKQGDAAWSTRGKWCMMYGKIGADSISIAIIDNPKNINYPTFWHARGYGLFAANPLGEKIFTNGKSEKNLKLQKGESVTFRYRIVVSNGKNKLTVNKLYKLADEFAMSKN